MEQPAGGGRRRAPVGGDQGPLDPGPDGPLVEVHADRDKAVGDRPRGGAVRDVELAADQVDHVPPGRPAGGDAYAALEPVHAGRRLLAQVEQPAGVHRTRANTVTASAWS